MNTKRYLSKSAPPPSIPWRKGRPPQRTFPVLYWLVFKSGPVLQAGTWTGQSFYGSAIPTPDKPVEGCVYRMFEEVHMWAEIQANDSDLV